MRKDSWFRGALPSVFFFVGLVLFAVPATVAQAGGSDADMVWCDGNTICSEMTIVGESWNFELGYQGGQWLVPLGGGSNESFMGNWLTSVPMPENHDWLSPQEIQNMCVAARNRLGIETAAGFWTAWWAAVVQRGGVAWVRSIYGSVFLGVLITADVLFIINQCGGF